MQPVIRFENVCKLYRLGTVGTGTITHDLRRWWITNVRHKEDPYLKIGETNDRSTKGSSDYVYALKDINFEVQEGDVLGIIGKNGAGKSTLLKLISRVTAPTTGKIYTKGRIASLLEVGTGFHPELTGRENIYMNGCILGMKRWEIDKKLDEIVDFSGCERYIDTPVKRYSSGMMVRLGFAVAAHLDPEILVVDEVLAVGDAEFQKKAIGKMQDVSKGQGRTVLFVSHNMGSVRSICQRSIILDRGQIAFYGQTEETIEKYTNLCNSEDIEITGKLDPTILKQKNRDIYSKDIEILDAQILNANPDSISNNEPITYCITVKQNNPIYNQVQICISFIAEDNVRITYHVSPCVELKNRISKIILTLSRHNLPAGIFTARIETGIRDFSNSINNFNFDAIDNALPLRIKYLDKTLKNEFALWSNAWGRIYQEDDSIEIYTV